MLTCFSTDDRTLKKWLNALIDYCVSLAILQLTKKIYWAYLSIGKKKKIFATHNVTSKSFQANIMLSEIYFLIIEKQTGLLLKVNIGIAIIESKLKFKLKLNLTKVFK